MIKKIIVYTLLSIIFMQAVRSCNVVRIVFAIALIFTASMIVETITSEEDENENDI